MMATRLQKVLADLQKTADPAEIKKHVLRDPLDIILFENVAYLVGEAAHWAAFENLKQLIDADPAKLLAVPDSVLLDIVRPPGHARMLVAKLREIALIVAQEFDGDIKAVLKMSTAAAKRSLMKFPGIGEPGAEKILLFSRSLPILALDSNGLRVLLRLGYGEEQKSYKATYRRAQEAAMIELGHDCEGLIKAYLLLQEHGRMICRRTNPLCDVCPVSRHCRYYAKQIGTR